MADTKISDLPAVTDVIGTDEYVLARSGVTKKIDATDLLVAEAVSVTDSGGYFTGTDVEAALQEIGAGGLGGGGGSALSRSISQTSHGLAVGDVVRLSGTSYVEAQATSEANAEVVGIVSAVADANTFTLTTGGYVEGLSGLTAGVVYYLSETAGQLTTTEPTISKPLLVASSTTTGWFFNMRGLTGGGGGDAGANTQLEPFGSAVRTGSWSLGSNGSTWRGNYVQSNTVGDKVEWPVWLPAGTYTLGCMGIQNSDTGKVGFYLNGTQQGSFVDFYDPSLVFNADRSVTGIAVSGGAYTFRVQVETKNASSSNNYISLTLAFLIRTA